MTDLRDAELSRGLRRSLMDAGLDTNQWSDRHLLCVEITANAIADGEAVFVSREMKPLVDALVPKTKTDELR
jgi:hypothetical protein